MFREHFDVFRTDPVEVAGTLLATMLPPATRPEVEVPLPTENAGDGHGHFTGTVHVRSAEHTTRGASG
jgi:hypothetical protein